MPYSYYCGLDIGLSKDYTAFAVLEQPFWVPSSAMDRDGPDRWGYSMNLPRAGWVSPSELNKWQCEEVFARNFHEGRPAGPPLYLRDLRRFELGTDADEVARELAELLSRPVFAGKRVAFLVDRTGPGNQVLYEFRRAGLNPISVFLHGGDRARRDISGGFVDLRVPKREIVFAAQTLVEQRRLKVAPQLPLWPVLREELLNFKPKMDPRTNHDSYAVWREGIHDDLVIAASMACWYQREKNKHLDPEYAMRGWGVATVT
jgi:hypothetical protein